VPNGWSTSSYQIGSYKQTKFRSLNPPHNALSTTSHLPHITFLTSVHRSSSNHGRPAVCTVFHSGLINRLRIMVNCNEFCTCRYVAVWQKHCVCHSVCLSVCLSVNAWTCRYVAVIQIHCLYLSVPTGMLRYVRYTDSVCLSLFAGMFWYDRYNLSVCICRNVAKIQIYSVCLSLHFGMLQ